MPGARQARLVPPLSHADERVSRCPSRSGLHRRMLYEIVFFLCRLCLVVLLYCLPGCCSTPPHSGIVPHARSGARECLHYVLTSTSYLFHALKPVVRRCLRADQKAHLRWPTSTKFSFPSGPAISGGSHEVRRQAGWVTMGCAIVPHGNTSRISLLLLI